MIDFLGSSVYEIDLSHIEGREILQGNYDHIQRFVKLLYEWTLFQTGNVNTHTKKHLELGNSDCMPTVDTYGNINSGTQNKTDIIDFYQKAKPELILQLNSQPTSKFRILSNNDELENSELHEIFKNTVGNENTPSKTPSMTTSVNTTILGPNGNNNKNEEQFNILNQVLEEESSYEKSVEKGLIRSQVIFSQPIHAICNCCGIKILQNQYI